MPAAFVVLNRPFKLRRENETARSLTRTDARDITIGFTNPDLTATNHCIDRFPIDNSENPVYNGTRSNLYARKEPRYDKSPQRLWPSAFS